MNTYNLRGLWLVSALLLSALVGAGAGVLTYLAGDNGARATIAGCAAFGCTTIFLLLIITFILPTNSLDGSTPSGPGIPPSN
jgi:hypothetical protein